jgi:hypothetical protein
MVLSAFNPGSFSQPFINPDQFINSLNTSEAIVLQGLLVLSLLLALLWCLKNGGPQGLRRHAFTALVLSELLIATQMNAPVTVVSSFRADKTTRLIENFTTPGYPIPPLLASGRFNDSIPAPPPLWRNLNIFKKLPAVDGYNSFQTRSYVDFTDKPAVWESRKSRPWMFFATQVQSSRDLAGTVYEGPGYAVYTAKEMKGSLPGGQLKPTRFQPCHIAASVLCDSDQSLLVVLQQDAPFWRVRVDGRQVSKVLVDGLFIGLCPGKGDHAVEIEYVNVAVNGGFYLAIICWILLLGTIVWQIVRLQMHKRQSTLR